MQSIAPEQIRRTHQSPDVDDLAVTYAEEEIGRFDFKNNWDAVKARGNARERIQDWLARINVNINPEEIILAIDRLAANRPGRWV